MSTTLVTMAPINADSATTTGINTDRFLPSLVNGGIFLDVWVAAGVVDVVDVAVATVVVEGDGGVEAAVASVLAVANSRVA